MRVRRKCRLLRRRIHKCRATARARGAVSCMLSELRGETPICRGETTHFPTPGRRGGQLPIFQAWIEPLETPLASKRVRSERMARRPNAAVGVVCPRCGMLAARIIGRSESLPVIYLTVRGLRPHVGGAKRRAGVTISQEELRAKCRERKRSCAWLFLLWPT